MISLLPNMTEIQKHNDDIAYFIAFCIEIYKNDKKMRGRDASQLFNQTGLTEFLAENYEPIHTQSPQWILEELNKYISKKQSLS